MDPETRRKRFLGLAGEFAAAALLVLTGHRILARNWRCRRGELDIVARRGGVVVFVEVRTRMRGALVDPLLTVDTAKMARIVGAARLYLASRRQSGHPCRFDIITVTVSRAFLPRLRHIRRAFDGDFIGHGGGGGGAGRGRRVWSRG